MLPKKLLSQPATSPSRRMTSRIPAPGDVWVHWQCEEREDISRVLDMSLGGLFIETSHTLPDGAVAELSFLVEEGQISANAVVKHTKNGVGLGFKFTGLTDEDGPKLTALMNRLRSTPLYREKS